MIKRNIFFIFWCSKNIKDWKYILSYIKIKNELILTLDTEWWAVKKKKKTQNTKNVVAIARDITKQTFEIDRLIHPRPLLHLPIAEHDEACNSRGLKLLFSTFLVRSFDLFSLSLFYASFVFSILFHAFYRSIYRFISYICMHCNFNFNFNWVSIHSSNFNNLYQFIYLLIQTLSELLSMFFFLLCLGN